MKIGRSFVQMPPIQFYRKHYVVIAMIQACQNLFAICKKTQENRSPFFYLIQYISCSFYFSSSYQAVRQQVVLFLVLLAYLAVLVAITLYAMTKQRTRVQMTRIAVSVFFVSYQILVGPLACMASQFFFNFQAAQILMPGMSAEVFQQVRDLTFVVVGIIIGFILVGGTTCCALINKEDFMHRGIVILSGKLLACENLLRWAVFFSLYNVNATANKCVFTICCALAVCLQSFVPLIPRVKLYGWCLGARGAALTISVSFVFIGVNVWTTYIGLVVVLCSIFGVIIAALIQTRLNIVIEQAIQWLLARPQTQLPQTQLDMELFYVAEPFWIQLLDIALSPFRFLIVMLDKVIRRMNIISLQAWVIKTFHRKLFTVETEYQNSNFANQLTKYNTTDLLRYKHFKKVIEVRKKFLEIRQDASKQLKLRFLTPLDFDIVAFYIANEYVNRAATDYFQGQLLMSHQLDVIDVQPLKHLEFIVQAKYPGSQHIKLTYAYVLAQMLNDIAQAQIQLQIQYSMNQTTPFILQMQVNETVLRDIYGRSIEDILNHEQDRGQKKGILMEKLLAKLKIMTMANQQAEVIKVLLDWENKIDDELRGFWSDSSGPGSDYHKLYNAYGDFHEQLLQVKKLSINPMLYEIFHLAEIKYFGFEDPRPDLMKTYLHFRAKYQYAEQYDAALCVSNFVVINHYAPSMQEMRDRFGGQPLILLRSQTANPENVSQVVRSVKKQNKICGPEPATVELATVRLVRGGVMPRSTLATAKTFKRNGRISAVMVLLLNICAFAAMFCYQEQELPNKLVEYDKNYWLGVSKSVNIVQCLEQFTLSTSLKINQQQAISKQADTVIDLLYTNSDQSIPQIVPVEMSAYVGKRVTLDNTANHLYASIKQLSSTFPAANTKDFAYMRQSAQHIFTQTFPPLAQQFQISEIAFYGMLTLLGFWLVKLIIRSSLSSTLQRDLNIVTRLLQQIPHDIRSFISQYFLKRYQTRKRFAAIRKTDIFQYLDMVIAGIDIQPQAKEIQSLQTLGQRQQLVIPPYKNPANKILTQIRNGLTLFVAVISIVLAALLCLDEARFEAATKVEEVRYLDLKTDILLLQNELTKTQLLSYYFYSGKTLLIDDYKALTNVSLADRYDRISSKMHAFDQKNFHDTYLQLSTLFGELTLMESLRNLALAIHDGDATLINTYAALLEDQSKIISAPSCTNIFSSAENTKTLSPYQIVTSCQSVYIGESMFNRIGYIIKWIDNQAVSLTEDIAAQFMLAKPIFKQFLTRSQFSASNSQFTIFSYQNPNQPQMLNTITSGDMRLDAYEQSFLFNYLVGDHRFNGDNETVSNILNDIAWSDQASIRDDFIRNLRQVRTFGIVTSCILVLIVIVQQQKHPVKVLIVLGLLCLLLMNAAFPKQQKFYSESIAASQILYATWKHIFTVHDMARKFIASSETDYGALEQLLRNLYQFYSLYTLGQDVQSMPLWFVYDKFDYQMHGMGCYYLLPLSIPMRRYCMEEIQKTITNELLAIDLTDIQRSKNQHLRLIVESAQQIQQYIKQLWKAITIKCRFSAQAPPASLLKSKYFTPIKYLLSLGELDEQIQFDGGYSHDMIALSPPMYSGDVRLKGSVFWQNATVQMMNDILMSKETFSAMESIMFYRLSVMRQQQNDLSANARHSINKRLYFEAACGVLGFSLVLLLIIQLTSAVRASYTAWNLTAFNVGEAESPNVSVFPGRTLLQYLSMLFAAGYVVFLLFGSQILQTLQQINTKVDNIQMALSNLPGSYGCKYDEEHCVYKLPYEYYRQKAANAAFQLFLNEEKEVKSSLSANPQSYAEMISLMNTARASEKYLSTAPLFLQSHIWDRVKSNTIQVPVVNNFQTQSMVLYFKLYLENIYSFNTIKIPISSVFEAVLHLKRNDLLTDYEVLFNHIQLIDGFDSISDLVHNKFDQLRRICMTWGTVCALLAFVVITTLELHEIAHLRKLHRHAEFGQKLLATIPSPAFQALSPETVLAAQ